MGFLDEYDHLEEARSLHRRYPEDPSVTLLSAVCESEAGNWTQCREILEKSLAEGLPESARQHRLHLLGLSRFHVGDLAGARAAWEEGLECDGNCSLEHLHKLLTPGDGDDASPVQRLIAAVHAADEHLESGKPKAAIEALKLPCLFQLLELQGLARLAQAHLWLDDDGPVFAFNKAAALAAFCAAYGDRDNKYRHHLEIPGLAWSRDRLDELHERVRAWLEAR